MINVVKDEVVPVVIRGALTVALLGLWWTAFVVFGSLAVLTAYAATGAAVFLTLHQSMALIALAPMTAYGAYRLIEDGFTGP
ncbi:hypothetical protein [Chthonobacter rhizosphaerae]|uniref:hypothetical protein n=1 Tax=Chthonobacter rhizosphaerae TaxID=2735553 RepID=UPI0015EF3466|nr:hypothetical protein [Chthonobacter rhizosphaerae]